MGTKQTGGTFTETTPSEWTSSANGTDDAVVRLPTDIDELEDDHEPSP